MNKYSKPLSLSPQARLPEGARILMPQRVDITSDKFAVTSTKQAFSRSQQNIEPSLNNPSPRVKKVRNETFHDIPRKDLKSSQVQRRVDTVQGNEHYKGLGGILKNTSNGPRPTTSGEGYLSGALASPKEKQLYKSDPKLKKLGSLFPTYKGGDFMGGPQQKAPEYIFETTKEDREAVQELEKWDSEFKVVAVSKKVETDQKKDNNQMPFQGEYFDNYKTPALNREILNLIDEDEGFAEKDPKLVAANITKLSKQKGRVPQKSIETIMTEYNKKILNEILFQRVSKKLNSPTQNNRLDLDYATKTVSTDTIGNFKNLQHALQANPRIIEYEDLYKKLAVQRKPPEKIFDFEEDCKKMQDAEEDYESIEAGLKTQYEAIIVEIHKKKDTLNEIRLAVHNNNNEITELEEEIEDLMKKYEVLESQHNQQKEQNKVLVRSNTRAKRSGVNNAPRSTGFVEEYSKLQRQMDEKKEQIRDLKEMIQNLESENAKSQQRAENFEREIKDLKFKKNQIKIQLKQQYFKMLKNEEHIFKNEASFITIIKNLWKINEDILEDMFPGFVDKESLSYLIENAKLEYELEQLEALTRSSELKEYRYSEPQQFEEAKNRFRESQKSLKAPLSEQLTDVKKRLQNLKKGIVKMKKPVFIKDGASKSRVIRWEELNVDNDEWNLDQMNGHSFQEKINTTIADIKAKLADLKEKEINRIFSLYINRDIDEKNLKNLNKILISLFGRHDAEKTYHAFVRLKQAHDLKISQNKTFVFSSTKQFSSTKTNDKSKNSFIMMLSNATNFRNEKPKSTKDQEEQDKRKADAESFNRQLTQYQEISNLEVNANYNINYNYAPGFLDKDFRSSFYLSKNFSPKETNNNSLKSSMKDKEKLMIKTSESFNKVSFKEPARLY